MGVHEHKRDDSGATVRTLLEEAGHAVVSSQIIPDDRQRIVACARQLASTAAEAVVMTGGTGISPRDNTYEALNSLLTRRIDGLDHRRRGVLRRDDDSARVGPGHLAGLGHITDDPRTFLVGP